MALYDQTGFDFAPIPLLWGGEVVSEEIQPLRKASDDPSVSDVVGPDGAWIMKGWVSGENLDADNQVVVQSGIDWRLFDKNPIFSDGHPATPDTIVGHARVRKGGLMPNGVPGTWMECALFKGDEDTNPLVARAAKLWRQHRALCKGPTRRGLGFSVEGWATEIDGHRITKSVVTSVAIDIAPKHPGSYAMQAALAKAGGDVSHFHALMSGAPPAFHAFMKAAALASDPRARQVLELTQGIPLEQVAALRLLNRNPQGTMREALARVASAGVFK